MDDVALQCLEGNAEMSERTKMAIAIVNHHALDHEYEKLVALLTCHTDGQGDGSYPTAIDKLAFRRESFASTSLHNRLLS